MKGRDIAVWCLKLLTPQTVASRITQTCMTAKFGSSVTQSHLWPAALSARLQPLQFACPPASQSIQANKPLDESIARGSLTHTQHTHHSFHCSSAILACSRRPRSLPSSFPSTLCSGFLHLPAFIPTVKTRTTLDGRFAFITTKNPRLLRQASICITTTPLQLEGRSRTLALVTQPRTHGRKLFRILIGTVLLDSCCSQHFVRQLKSRQRLDGLPRHPIHLFPHTQASRQPHSC